MVLLLICLACTAIGVAIAVWIASGSTPAPINDAVGNELVEADGDDEDGKPGEKSDYFYRLHKGILTGEFSRPTVLSRTWWAWQRWVLSHGTTVTLIKQIVAAAEGNPPVVFEPAPQSLGMLKSMVGAALGISGKDGIASPALEAQTTTNLAAGWNPNHIGAPAPAIGMPIGRSDLTGRDVGFDVFAWWQQGIIPNPSAFVMSLPSLGKSTLIRKVLLGHLAQGQRVIVAGDIKAEYVYLTQLVGGQVLRVGHGEQSINPLDTGALGATVPQLEAANVDVKRIDAVKEQVHTRQVTMVISLVGLGRQGEVKDYEGMIISTALRDLYVGRPDRWATPPVLQDLIDAIEEGSEDLRGSLEIDADDLAGYRKMVTPLLLSLRSLLDGATGKIFSGESTEAIDLDAPMVCIDVSTVPRGDDAMKAAVLMACWSAAFGAVEASHVLAEAGLREEVYYAAVLDELWQTLAAAPGLVGRIDELTRLNRTDGVGLYMITHTSRDLEALPTQKDIKTAMGFIDRAGAVIAGGLPADELDLIAKQLPFKRAEAQRVVSWSSGSEAKDERSVDVGERAGLGKFCIKSSKDGQSGIAVQVLLGQIEFNKGVHDTNRRFSNYLNPASRKAAERDVAAAEESTSTVGRHAAGVTS